MKLVPNFWKSWSWMAASTGLVLPEVLSLVAEHSALIPGIAPDKDGIRLLCLVLVVVLRPIKQSRLA